MATIKVDRNVKIGDTIVDNDPRTKFLNKRRAGIVFEIKDRQIRGTKEVAKMMHVRWDDGIVTWCRVSRIKSSTTRSGYTLVKKIDQAVSA